MIEILSSIKWGPAEVVSPGVFARVADVTNCQAFWGEWRTDKNYVKSFGISVKPADGGWSARWVYAETSETAATVFNWVCSEAGQRGENICAAMDEEQDDGVQSWSRSGAGAQGNPLAPFRCEPLPPGVNYSPEQLAIFDFFRTAGSGNLVVDAYAGVGKTFTSKIAFSQAPERDMLYAIFGKKNEREAREKITDPRVTIKTLHALGLMFIQRVWSGSKPVANDVIEGDRFESLYGRSLPTDVRTAVLKLVAFGKNIFIDPTVIDLITLAEDRQVDAEAFEDDGFDVPKLASMALAVINAARTRDPQRRIGFNDMVWMPVAMGWVRPMFDLVLIDEAQDMNLPQLLMARGACRKGGRVIVVGDKFQAIYEFRGAVSDGMDMMRRDLNATSLGLSVTYRCPKAVVALAQEFVPMYRAADNAPEGVIEHIKLDAVVKAAKIGDAILSRANAPLMPLCLSLLKAGIPARIEGRDVGKMLLNIITKLKARSVPDYLSRVEAWGDRQTARCMARKHTDAQLDLITDQVETLVAIADGALSVAEIEARCTNLFSNADDEGVKPSVVLSSVHKAKGLEWDRVFIVRETFLRPGRVTQEEKNIYYVAITRTKHTLTFIGEPAKADKEKE